MRVVRQRRESSRQSSYALVFLQLPAAVRESGRKERWFSFFRLVENAVPRPRRAAIDFPRPACYTKRNGLPPRLFPRPHRAADCQEPDKVRCD